MTAQSVLTFVEIWCWTGFAVAALFLVFGIHKIDEDADGAVAFRPLLIVGIMLVWPLVLWRWFLLATDRDQWRRRHVPPRATHLYAALFLVAAILISITLSLALRQTWPADIAPERLSEADLTE